ncbi:MAG: HU family DNA-binding protein [Candidatus Aminicenantes bacterium]|nr:HU family DNA-binding protein [Candidatus Aminicenantes bacterium]
MTGEEISTSLPPQAVQKIPYCIDACMVNTLEEKGVVTTGLGMFKMMGSSERRGRNQVTGSEVILPASRRVSFRLADSLKK